MPLNYYDDALIAKINKWIPDNAKIRVLRPDESKRLYELVANDSPTEEFTLPLVALSRDPDFRILSTAKQSKSFDGLHLLNSESQTLQFNVIPITTEYELEIYAKKQEDCNAYVREFVFKLINNPSLKIEIPYNKTNIEHIANIRLLDTVADTSASSERIFGGQFSRYSIHFTLQDAFLFSIPYRRNWKFVLDDTAIELTDAIGVSGELEYITENEIKYTWAPDYSACLAQILLNNNVVVEEWGTVTRVVDSTNEHMIGMQEKYHYEATFNHSRFSTQITAQFLDHPGGD